MKRVYEPRRRLCAGTGEGVESDFDLVRPAPGDPDAFAVLCRRYIVVVDAWLRHRTGNAAVAADLSSETFAQAWISLGRLAISPQQSLAPWLFGIAGNLVRAYHRHGRVERAGRRRLQISFDPSQEDEEQQRIDERLGAEAVRAELEAALLELPLNHREAVTLRVVDELAYRDVSARLGCSENVARVYVARALARLRSKLSEVQP
jgi:RNA polymerase sigma factor (sigma-70 family)